MNERTKQIMSEQMSAIYNNLKNQFGVAVYEDEIAEDEEKSFEKQGYNCFVFETGDFQPTNDIKKLTQNIQVYYFSENRTDVDEQTIDVISTLNSVKGLIFSGSSKERLQMKDTDRYIDRVTINFTRKIPIECQV